MSFTQFHVLSFRQLWFFENYATCFALEHPPIIVLVQASPILTCTTNLADTDPF